MFHSLRELQVYGLSKKIKAKKIFDNDVLINYVEIEVTK